MSLEESYDEVLRERDHALRLLARAKGWIEDGLDHTPSAPRTILTEVDAVLGMTNSLDSPSEPEVS